MPIIETQERMLPSVVDTQGMELGVESASIEHIYQTHGSKAYTPLEGR